TRLRCHAVSVNGFAVGIWAVPGEHDCPVTHFLHAGATGRIGDTAHLDLHASLHFARRVFGPVLHSKASHHSADEPLVGTHHNIVSGNSGRPRVRCFDRGREDLQVRVFKGVKRAL